MLEVVALRFQFLVDFSLQLFALWFQLLVDFAFKRFAFQFDCLVFLLRAFKLLRARSQSTARSRVVTPRPLFLNSCACHFVFQLAPTSSLFPRSFAPPSSIPPSTRSFALATRQFLPSNLSSPRVAFAAVSSNSCFKSSNSSRFGRVTLI